MARINISVDAKLKNDAEKLFNDLGLSLSSAITLFLRQAVKEQAIPFEISLLKTSGEGTLESYYKALARYEANPVTYSLDEVEERIARVDSTQNRR